ncbi:MAG: hypothetical protein LBE92_20910 [Chryseobacterium sp.]|uniref:hypothetical protein n=1 Tax=Chryseobacterium sp. TaxID=1871047 RepID=UPI00281B7287|nr:hypothetical protein [Chryseobacterium sp.]MDR2238598.1 hypothetical protein [Chryseobacterium sp.]
MKKALFILTIFTCYNSQKKNYRDKSMDVVIKTKTILKFLFILTIFCCKGEPVKKDNIKKNKINERVNIERNNIPNPISESCYDYLTELVRSSDFPFSEWKINKDKVNLLIDENSGNTISCKLFFETEGTGTIGWVEYNKNDGKLFNTSANLENPVELKYEQKWKVLFDECLSGNVRDINKNKALEKIYNKCNELPLPNRYDYDAIAEENGFIELDKEYYNLFPLEHQDNYKIAKLPPINENIKPVILITYNDSGQSSWHLFIFNNDFLITSNIILYTSQESNNGNGDTTIYSISRDYKIKITKTSNSKIISNKLYTISKDGLIK